MLFRIPRPADMRHRRPRGVPRHLSPRQMRDIGLDPWPEEPLVVPRHLW